MDSTMAVAQRMTVEEYLKIADDLPHRTSLVEGEVVVNQPTPLHQGLLLDLAFILKSWCQAQPGRGEVTAPLDVQLGDRNYFAPDLMWWRSGRERGRRDTRPQPLPDIAVEIRSPSTWRYDIGSKKTRYEQHGLRELWLVDSVADEVIVFRRSAPAAPEFDISLQLARGDSLTSPQLPGFALPLDDLFTPKPAG